MASTFNIQNSWWKVWNRIAYRKPVGREGIDYKMAPRWRRRGPTAKQVHQYEADLLDRECVMPTRPEGTHRMDATTQMTEAEYRRLWDRRHWAGRVLGAEIAAPDTEAPHGPQTAADAGYMEGLPDGYGTPGADSLPGPEDTCPVCERTFNLHRDALAEFHTARGVFFHADCLDDIGTNEGEMLAQRTLILDHRVGHTLTVDELTNAFWWLVGASYIHNSTLPGRAVDQAIRRPSQD